MIMACCSSGGLFYFPNGRGLTPSVTDWSNSSFNAYSIGTTSTVFIEAFDRLNNVVYGGTSSGGIIKVAEADFASSGATVKSGLAAQPLAMDVDPTNERIFYIYKDSGRSVCELRKVNYDGTSDGNVIDTGGITTNSACIYYSASDVVYYIHNDVSAPGGATYIYRVKPDGTSRTEIRKLQIASQAPAMNGLAIDITNHYLFWIENDGALSVNLYRSAMDGTGRTSIYSTGSALTSNRSIYFSQQSQKLYFNDGDHSKIRRMDYDGSNLEDLATLPIGSGGTSLTNGLRIWLGSGLEAAGPDAIV